MIFLSQILCIYFVVEIVKSAQINRNIIIDGNFDDWLNVQSYSDPQDNIDGTVYQESPWFSALKIPDCHDGTHMGNENIPKHIYNPNVDIVEFKIAHDDKSLYIYFRVADGGIIGKTSVGSGKFDENNPSNPSPGRFYVITSINLDMNEQTGYWLSEGGYYPTAPGLDGNFELEFYNGTYNQNYYLNHAGNSTNELNYTKEQNRQNQFILGTNFYSYYTQYIYWDHRPTENEIKKCLFGFYELPSPNNNNFICFSQDDAPGPFNGILSYAQSEKGNELEIRAPFQGFLLNKNTGEPTLQLGMTVNISLTLETSPEYSLPQEWCSDSAPTIQYTLSLGHKNQSEQSSYFQETIDIDFGFNHNPKRQLNLDDTHRQMSLETLQKYASLFDGFIINIGKEYFEQNRDRIQTYLTSIPDNKLKMILIRDVQQEQT